MNQNPIPPAAPTLSASVQACAVTLTIQDNSDTEDGFFVYALPETSVSFKRITSLKAHPGAGSLQYTLQNQRGHVQFFAAAYNTAGESPSAPAAVNVTASQCNPIQSNPGGLRYQNGFLSIPNNVQLAYFYASVNGGAWQRSPAVHTFINPTTGPVDLRPELNQMLGADASGELDLDVWGWSGETLVHLGQLHNHANLPTLEICNLTSVINCTGPMTEGYWMTELSVDPDKAETTRKLRWTVAESDVTYSIWQVSSLPFPAEYSVGAPPGLLISGISQATVSIDGFAKGDFTIDFKSDLQVPATQNAPTPNAAPTANARQWSTPDPDLIEELTGIISKPFTANMQSQKLYIRVMPIAGGHPGTEPSNSVRVSLAPSEETPPITINPQAAYKYKVEIVPGSYVNEIFPVLKTGILGCSIITAVDHDAFIEWYMQAYGTLANMAGAEQSYQFYYSHLNQPICPATVDMDPSITPEDIFNTLKSFWDALTSTFDQIKTGLVESIASFIPGCGATCQSLLMTGLNFTITFFTGLPPSIPSFDALVDMGLEYAVQIAITQAGIPYCDEICQKAISDTIQDVARTSPNRAKPSQAVQIKITPYGQRMGIISRRFASHPASRISRSLAACMNAAWCR